MLNISQLMGEQGEGELPGGNSCSSGVIWSSVFLPPACSGVSICIALRSCQPKHKNQGEGKERNPVSTRHSRTRVSCLWQAQIDQTRNCLLCSGEEASHGRQRPVTKFKKPLCRVRLVSQHHSWEQILKSLVQPSDSSSSLPRGCLGGGCFEGTASLMSAPTAVPCHLFLTSPSLAVARL